MSTAKNQYDVIIAGSGIYGTSLAGILAKSGLSVLVIERGKHPRFALGEALLPQSAIWPFIIGERFGIPEIGHLSHADRIVDHITPSCGLKHSIGFAHHIAGEPLKAPQLHQLVPPHLPFYSESHLYREEVDQFLLNAAIKYGADYTEETPITDVQIGADGVVISCPSKEYRGAYFVDASGRGSKLVEQRGYRAEAPEAKTHSRAIFAHVEGLQPFDNIMEAPSKGRKWHEGTFHHVFDGGWMWVIPFDNFSRSSSRKASVGLMLDPRIHPEDATKTAEEEFYSFIAGYPDMERHMEGIEVTMPFTRTGRLQYSSRQSVGERHFTAPSTFGFIDPLYSNGLIHTFESVYYGARHLLSAFGKEEGPVKKGDFSTAAFAKMEVLHRTQWNHADGTISQAYASMADFGTWNAWTQYWLAQILFGDLWLQRACFRYFEDGNTAHFDAFLDENRPGDHAPFAQDKRALLEDLGALLAVKGNGVVDTGEAMLQRLAEESWLPRHVFDWGAPEARNVDFSREEVVGALLGWGFESSPEHLRNGLFDFKLPEPA
jgi:FADH2 O2-dependent halogenase